MIRSRASLLAGVVVLLSQGVASAQPPDEALPPPREALREFPVLPMPSSPYPTYERTSRYDVWQNYGVDRHGFFRPRVIYSPAGAYYRYDGQPYPWAITHSLDFMPYATE